MALGIGHSGSWFGLPDFGITESIAGLTGNRNRSQDLGSNLFGANNANTNVLGQVDNNGGLSGAPSGISFGAPQPLNTLFNQKTPPPAGGGGGSQPSQSQPQQQSQSMSLPSNDQSGQINAGWDSYTNQLNDILNNNLPQQRQSQEQLAQNAYNTGVNQLGQQKTSSEQQVAKQQAASLKDLAGNVQNLFNAGNTYLGARGASDSSAANQYSYAISKMGTKARGDIQSQAQDRLSQIGDIYNSEINRLESDKNTQLAGIAQWFSEAQAALKQQLGQAGLGRSQDLQQASQNLYNQALQVMQTVQAEQANRRSALEAWALNNSKTVQEAMQNLQTVQQMPQFGGIQGGMPQVTAEGQQYIPTGYGATTNEQKDIFGNRIL